MAYFHDFCYFNQISLVIKNHERCNYSYIDLGAFLRLDFLKITSFPMLKGKQTPLWNINRAKVTKNVITLGKASVL